MKSIAAIVVACAVIAVIELRSLNRSGLKKERWTFSLLLLIGAALAIALSLHAPLPTPLKAIHALFGPMSKWLDSALSA